MYKFCLGFCLIMVLNSCKTINIQQSVHHTTTQQITLGGVGEVHNTLIPSGFNGVAIPNYNIPIKIQASILSFNKQTYKAYLNALGLQKDKEIVSDSIISSLKFVELHIADKVALIEAFNIPENKPLKEYFGFNSSANVVTDVSIKLNENDIKRLKESDAQFLEEIGLKTYGLQLYINGKKADVINLNKAVIFAYKTAQCCWQENNKHQINIVDLVGAYTNCPNKTYRSANRAKKKINYYKI